MVPPRLTMNELIAIRRLEVHDAAKVRNDKAREACELERAVRLVTFGPLYGSRPATMRTAFDTAEYWQHVGGFELRMEQRDEQLFDARATVTPQPSQCMPSEDPEVFCPFRCAPDPHQDCMYLSWQLATAWGDSTESVWRDRSTKTLARIVDAESCELRFQRYVERSGWIAMTTTAEIPLALIGESEKRLRPDSEHPLAGQAGWPLLVTGEHMLEARIDVFIENERIVGFNVWGDMEEDGGADELHEIVRPYLRSALHIELHTRGTTFELTVGKTP